MNETGPIHYLNLEYFFRLFYNWINGAQVPQADFSVLLAKLWSDISIIAYSVTAVCLLIFVYATVLLFRIREEEEEELEEKADAVRQALITPQPTRWQHIEELMRSEHINDWRQAIIEADVLLEETLENQGYMGETLADKLEQVGHRLASLNDAWEAHKVRNEIAHRGSLYELTEREARGAISHYETVFRELGVV